MKIDAPPRDEDVAAAVGWVHDHIRAYGGDPDRLALLGHSAGADIVANVADQPRYLASVGLAPADLDCAGPLDTEGFDKVENGLVALDLDEWETPGLVAAGEAIVVSGATGTPVGLVADLDHADDETDYAEPDFEPSPELCTVAWTVYSLPAAPTPEHFDLGDAEFALRSAVRSAADALGRLRAEGYGMGIDDPRGLIDQLVESTLAHRVPEHAPERAIRVLENATQVDAIITVSAGLMPAAMQSSSDAQGAGDTLRPLDAVVRTARLAAVSAILDSAWR